ncbi:MAG: glycosyltransferase family 2 protein [Candidatus Bathyarchaeia archaeon]
MVLVLLLAVYGWIFYNIPILAVGVWHMRRSGWRRGELASSDMDGLPTFSIVVPVRDEERVVGRLLEGLLRLDYPVGKREILIVEDGSSDRTVEICRDYVRRYSGQVRLLHNCVSNGKPSALNYALNYAKGDILAFFDADNVPEPDVLRRAVEYFKDASVAAVQGRLNIINAEENMLAKFVSYEEAAWCEAYLRGKDVLGLFVHMKGSCMFVGRRVLDEMEGFDEEALSEDMELSVRLTEGGYRVRYASDVCSWQEAPSKVGQLFNQRTRWFRGTMEVALKYGRLMAKPNWKNLDAEVTLTGPFILMASLTSYFLAFYASFVSLSFDSAFQFLMQFSAFATSVMVVFGGLALAYVSKPRRLANLFWLPFIYFYWSLQVFIALYAGLLMLLRKPRAWLKTEKMGTVAVKKGLCL